VVGLRHPNYTADAPQDTAPDLLYVAPLLASKKWGMVAAVSGLSADPRRCVLAGGTALRSLPSKSPLRSVPGVESGAPPTSPGIVEV